MGALTQAASTAVLWIHLTREDNCVVCDLRDGMIRHKIVSSVKIVPFVRQLLKSGGHSLVVVDGVANNPKNQAFVDVRSVARTWVMGDAHKRQLVYCASEALSSSGETAIAHGVEGASVAVVNEICSWTLDQVKMACANDDFWTSVKDCVTGGSDYDDRACAIDDKYVVAGVCARWMFGRTPKAVMSECDHWIKKVNNVSTFVDGVGGQMTRASTTFVASAQMGSLASSRTTLHARFFSGTW